jgi:ubiquinone/menaquinone biosynthesis C-methylase UbiE
MRNGEMADWLRPFQPRLPLAALVEQVNQLYHAGEADSYDDRHVEIMEQLPRRWRQMIQVALEHGPARPWRILDFGCGTGFASEQLLDALPSGDIEELICYDPSPDMLRKCRDKLARRGGRIRFIYEYEELFAVGPVHLLATNSVLHHLPEPFSTIAELEAILAPAGVWLAGHEPSCRFYRNSECKRLYRRFLKEEKLRQMFRPSRWLQRLAALFIRRHSPARQAARQAFQHGLFAVPPSPRVISRLVDYHVPRENSETAGFSLELMQENLAPRWRLLWQTSYAYLGRVYEGRLPGKWRERARELAERFPLDGANFCSVWQRTGGS